MVDYVISLFSNLLFGSVVLEVEVLNVLVRVIRDILIIVDKFLSVILNNEGFIVGFIMFIGEENI